MVRVISALVLVLLVAAPGLAQQSLVGTYKIISQDLDVDGTAIQPLGKAPHGYLVITPTRVVAFYTADNRKFGTSMDEKAALFDTLIGYAGTYRIEGGKIIIAVDTSFAEIWNGKNSVRHYALSGNRLTLTSDPEPYPRDPSKKSVVRQVWEKIE